MSLEKIAVSTDFQNFNFYKAPAATEYSVYDPQKMYGVFTFLYKK